MDRVNGLDFVDIGAGRRGFRSQNKLAGIVGTEVTSVFLNNVQEEILKVIEASGQDPSAVDDTQLWQALQILVGGGRFFRPVLSVTTTAPPGAPAEDDAYVVPAGATGAWAGHEQSMAVWRSPHWLFLAVDGHIVTVPDGRVFARLGGVYVEFAATDTLRGLTRLATQAEIDDGEGDGAVTAYTLTQKQTRLLLATASQAISAAAVNTLVTGYTISENTLKDSVFASGVLTVGADDAGVLDFIATAQAPNESGWVVAVWVHDVTHGVYHGGPGFVTGGIGFTSGTNAAVSLRAAAGDQFRLVCAANGTGVSLPVYLSIARRNG